MMGDISLYVLYYIIMSTLCFGNGTLKERGVHLKEHGVHLKERGVHLKERGVHEYIISHRPI